MKQDALVLTVKPEEQCTRIGNHQHPRWLGVAICCQHLDELIKQLMDLDRAVLESQAQQSQERHAMNGTRRQARWAKEAGLKRIGTPIDS